MSLTLVISDETKLSFCAVAIKPPRRFSYRQHATSTPDMVRLYYYQVLLYKVEAPAASLSI